VALKRSRDALELLDSTRRILAFAEEILPTAANLWTHASLDQCQRLQQLCLPAGIVCEQNQLTRAAVAAGFCSWLATVQQAG
jgi:hypothetical protein